MRHAWSVGDGGKPVWLETLDLGGCGTQHLILSRADGVLTHLSPSILGRCTDGEAPVQPHVASSRGQPPPRYPYLCRASPPRTAGHPRPLLFCTQPPGWGLTRVGSSTALAAAAAPALLPATYARSGITARGAGCRRPAPDPTGSRTWQRPPCCTSSVGEEAQERKRRCKRP